ncbi:aflatoxin B1 aldehyde reductase member 3-like [Xenia sp. Carnegie-2017]|uniref:aflatoxin B1 aldehyde reductase member 3-like n=1 Tax=Xenia sp. Carnegie-2017 TaxID=2897299 RepID=UPI001F046566|nr:aflatoxin B1 aldehyde reductase member 3-like [Xenia sp. Carnegie-2017]
MLLRQGRRTAVFNFVYSYQLRTFAATRKSCYYHYSNMVDTQIGTMEYGRQIDEQQSFKIMEYCLSKGVNWFDTALMYNGSKSEKIVGNFAAKVGRAKIKIATKAFPGYNDKGFSFDGIIEQLNESLSNLQTDYVDIFYLHYPDRNFPIEETLKACNELHKQGKFKELGVSNYASWELMDVYHICKSNNWVIPTVYQGMYNPLTRMVEAELFPCLRKIGVRFFAYNMLAGGLLTGKHKLDDNPEEQTKPGRFFGKEFWPSSYRKRFWHQEYFDGVEKIQKATTSCYRDENVSLIEVCTRWMYHHSLLSEKHGDGVIIGGSSPAQLENNLNFIDKGPLHPDIVAAFELSWERISGVCPRYNR